MERQWVVNTASGPRMIGGLLLAPGEGTWVDDQVFYPSASKDQTRLALTATQVASLAAAGTSVAPGVLLADPSTGIVYGQSDGLGGYATIGGGIGSGGYIGAGDQAAMLAVSGAVVGTFFTRTDTSPYTTWQLDVLPASTLANWRRVSWLSEATPIPQFDAEYPAQGFKPYVITGAGTFNVFSGACVFGWMRCIAVGGGTISGLYDANTATGTNLIPSKTFTANETFSLISDDANSDDNEGVLFDAGVTVTIAVGGTYEVWLRPPVVSADLQGVVQAWSKYVVASDTTPAGLNAPCRLRGLYCITAGTMAGVYDASGAATGTNIAPTSPTSALGKLRFGKRGGRPMAAGCFFDWSSGSFLALAAPVA